MRFGNLYNLCSYQSPYSPVADKVVKQHLEQAAEEARSHLEKAGIHPPVIPAQAGIQWLTQYIPA